MRIRMSLQLTGTRDGVRWPPPGGEVDLPSVEAAKLCAAGYAEPMADRGPSTATARKAETRKK